MGTDREIEIKIPSGKSLVLFDGVCNYCNSKVNFLMTRDKKERLLFSAQQSKAGQQIMERYQIDHLTMDTLVYIKNDRVFKRSRGVLEILKTLGGGWSLLYFFIIVPFFIRDAVYNFIAQRRYKWYGKSDACRLPQENEKHRFLD